MFERIIYVGDSDVEILLKEGILVNDVMNMPIILEDDNKCILAEIKELYLNKVRAKMLGELIDGNFVGGILRKPNLDSSIRSLRDDELNYIVGEKKSSNLLLGVSPFYGYKNIYVDLNELFSKHICIFGNTGSGKSCGVARIIQNVFSNEEFIPFKSNFLIFDSSGEYYNAFSNLNSINPNYNYKFITTNLNNKYADELLKIPVWLLNVADFALLLSATTHTQLSIIEKALKLVKIFSQSDRDAINYQNHLIASAIMTILYSNQTAASKRDEIFSILNTCATDAFNINSEIRGVGYTRTLQNCFLIDNSGNFSERVLLTEYVNKYIRPELNQCEPETTYYYNLRDFERALNFALISEGWLRNENVYADAITLKVKLHELVIGPYSKFFECKDFVRDDQFVSSLIINNNKKYQIVNINLEDVDDHFAKSVVKIYSRLLFDLSRKLDRASIPFNIMLEEAHRYVQKDIDEFLLGYNIFDRIAKEGRKYGVLLSLISQSPVDVSDTVISQCSNFLIFKMSHPRDIEYITKMIPNITDDVIEKQKSLQVGNCLAFGNGFKIPLIAKLELPNPEPYSNSCDVVNCWTSK